MGNDFFNDSIDDLIGDSSAPKALPQDAGFARIREREEAKVAQGVVERCPKCRGTGRFVSYSGRSLGQCFACKGVGSKTFKNDAATRAHNREMVAARAERKAATQWENFAQANAAEAAWIVEQAPHFGFAASMREAASKYGALTDGQMAAVRRGIIRSETYKAERAARQAERAARQAAAAASVSVAAPTFPNLRAAFDGLVARGAKKAGMTFDAIHISLAGQNSRNPGALYVKASGQYVGKIVGTEFKGWNVAPEITAALQLIESDPQGAVRAQAEKTALRIKQAEERGEQIDIPCGICGILLTDPESRARGIGPICAGKWGL